MLLDFSDKIISLRQVFLDKSNDHVFCILNNSLDFIFILTVLDIESIFFVNPFVIDELKEIHDSLLLEHFVVLAKRITHDGNEHIQQVDQKDETSDDEE